MLSFQCKVNFSLLGGTSHVTELTTWYSRKEVWKGCLRKCNDGVVDLSNETELESDTECGQCNICTRCGADRVSFTLCLSALEMRFKNEVILLCLPYTPSNLHVLLRLYIGNKFLLDLSTRFVAVLKRYKTYCYTHVQTEAIIKQLKRPLDGQYFCTILLMVLKHFEILRNLKILSVGSIAQYTISSFVSFFVLVPFNRLWEQNVKKEHLLLNV